MKTYQVTVRTPIHPECTHGPLPLGACSKCTSAAVLRRRMYQPEPARAPAPQAGA